MTAPHHAAARSMPAEALDALLSAIATLATAICGWARYLRARVVMRLGRLDDAEMAAAKLAFDGDADGPGGPLEHLPSCDGTCGGAVAHAAHLDDGWCPCCYCAQFAVDGPQDAATTSPPVEAAGLPGDGAPVRPGQPKRDTWVTWQDAPGTPRPVLAVRRDGLIGIDGHGHITIEPAGTRPPATTLTGPQPMMTIRTITRPNVAAEPDPAPSDNDHEPAIVRPYVLMSAEAWFASGRLLGAS